jgi:hypothetical protein
MMVKQIRLAFLEENGLETLWEQFPERQRDEVTQQWARLMARASLARIRALRSRETTQEVSDESRDG